MILLLNAPPGSGKDYAGSYLKERWNFTVFSFATPVKEATMRFYDLPENAWKTIERDGRKDEPRLFLDGLTLRQAYIWISESAKTVHGENYWAEKIASQIGWAVKGRNQNQFNIVITDLGFCPEAILINDKFDDVSIVRIITHGTTFENDSRSWVEVEGIPSYVRCNDRTLNFDKELDNLVELLNKK